MNTTQLQSILLPILLFSQIAQAQVTQDQPYVESFNVNLSLLEPDADVGRIDCISTEIGCSPLNAAACDVARDIDVGLTRSNTLGVPVNSRLWTWYSGSNDCTGDLVRYDNNNIIIKEEQLDSDAPFVQGSSDGTFHIPDDSDELSSFTTQDIMAHIGACAGEGVDREELFICFAIDIVDFNNVSDDIVTANEPYGYLRFEIDTIAPDTPTDLSVDGTDGSLQLSVTLPDPEDVEALKVYRAIDEDYTSCADVIGAEDVLESLLSINDSEDSPSVRVAGANGTTYALCTEAVDRAGNTSSTSEVVTGTPIDECDFFECYPGGPPTTGACQNADFSGILPSLALLIFLRRRRHA